MWLLIATPTRLVFSRTQCVLSPELESPRGTGGGEGLGLWALDGATGTTEELRAPATSTGHNTLANTAGCQGSRIVGRTKFEGLSNYLRATKKTHVIRKTHV